MVVHNTLTVGEIGSSPTNPTKCKICGKEFINTKKLKLHLNSHDIKGYFDWYQYLHKYENLSIPLCPYCGNICKLTSRRGYQKTCGSKECKHKFNSQNHKEKYLQHPEWRELHKKLRNNFLSKQSNRDKTAWMNKANGKYSYLEKYFIDNYLIPNKLQTKFNIINEYSEYPYFLDFAFIDIKVDIELDGKCHFEHGVERLKHDIIRDKDLIKKGWRIYRISFDEIENEQTKIKFYKFIDNFNEYDYNENRQIIKYNQYKNIKKKQSIIKKLDKKEKEKSKIIEILNSIGENYDLSKFGYGKIIQNELLKNNISIKGNIKRYINTHYPEFFSKYKVYNT